MCSSARGRLKKAWNTSREQRRRGQTTDSGMISRPTPLRGKTSGEWRSRRSEQASTVEGRGHGTRCDASRRRKKRTSPPQPRPKGAQEARQQRRRRQSGKPPRNETAGASTRLCPQSTKDARLRYEHRRSTAFPRASAVVRRDSAAWSDEHVRIVNAFSAKLARFLQQMAGQPWQVVTRAFDMAPPRLQRPQIICLFPIRSVSGRGGQVPHRIPRLGV